MKYDHIAICTDCGYLTGIMVETHKLCSLHYDARKMSNSIATISCGHCGTDISLKISSEHDNKTRQKSCARQLCGNVAEFEDDDLCAWCLKKREKE